MKIGNYKLKEINGRYEYSDSLDLRGTGITNTEHVKKDVPKVLYWKNGKYLKADGIFSEVVSKRANCWKLKSIGKSEVFFLVTDGNGKFAHGKTIKQAKADLIYKLSDGVDKEQFKNLSQDSVLTFEQCIELYRSVTGACAFGVKRFIESNNIENRSYTLAEIIKKTDGQYGSDALKAFYGFRQTPHPRYGWLRRKMIDDGVRG